MTIIGRIIEDDEREVGRSSDRSLPYLYHIVVAIWHNDGQKIHTVDTFVVVNRKVRTPRDYRDLGDLMTKFYPHLKSVTAVMLHDSKLMHRRLHLWFNRL